MQKGAKAGPSARTPPCEFHRRKVTASLRKSWSIVADPMAEPCAIMPPASSLAWSNSLAAGGSRAIHPRVLIDGHEKIRVAGRFDPGSDSSEPADAAFPATGPAPAHHPFARHRRNRRRLAPSPGYVRAKSPSNSISSRTYNSPALTVGPHPRLRPQVHDRVRHRARRQRHHHRYHRDPCTTDERDHGTLRPTYDTPYASTSRTTTNTGPTTLQAAALLRPLPQQTTEMERLQRLEIRTRDRLGGILREYHHTA